MRQDDDSDQQTGDDECEDTRERTLSFNIEEDNVNYQHAVSVSNGSG